MKLLYLVPKIKNAGGVARVISLKANYFAEHFGYEVHILSQNEEFEKPFYDFNSKIVFHNMNLDGNIFQFFYSFKNNINQKINEINPDLILVTDNGLKAFLIPFIVQSKTPIVFEVHGSKFIEEQTPKTDFASKFISKTKYRFKDFAARRFTKIVALSQESLQEWNSKNGIVIPNPSWIKTDTTAALKDKKVVAIARYSYEKGLDRLLLIWEKAIEEYPDWTLDIYTDNKKSLTEIVTDLGISSTVHIHDFVKNIEEKYLESSIYAMTSRTEGFPMVLIEAISFGIPCIAFDCPVGPRTIIKDNENGFLIPDNDFDLYVEKLSFLMENEEIRIQFGKNGKEISNQFSIEKIMNDWKMFFEKIIV